MASSEQTGRTRRSFTDEYKAEVIELCRHSGKPIAEISRDLDLTESAVRRWVAQCSSSMWPSRGGRRSPAGRRSVAKVSRRRASRLEHEQRLAEISELLVARASTRAIVRYASETWGVGERAAEKYLAEARQRLREQADFDRPTELGKALGGYELIFRRQLKAGDLRAARATLDKLVGLLGLAAPRQEVLSLAAIDAEISRLEAELAAREQQVP